MMTKPSGRNQSQVPMGVPIVMAQSHIAPTASCPMPRFHSRNFSSQQRSTVLTNTATQAYSLVSDPSRDTRTSLPGQDLQFRHQGNLNYGIANANMFLTVAYVYLCQICFTNGNFQKKYNTSK